MKKLVISFSGLFNNLPLALDDLNDYLYFFGCTRDHVMAPLPNKLWKKSGDNLTNTCGEWIYRLQSQGKYDEFIIDFLRRIQFAFLKAESEGRLVWRNGINGMDDECRWLSLVQLLKNNGYNVSMPERDGYFNYPFYCYPKVRQLFESIIEVVW